MRILWAGYGDLARRATPALVRSGIEVVALQRSPFPDPPDGVMPLVGDLVAPGDLQLPPDIRACVVTMTPDTRDRAGYEAAYVTATHNLHRLLEVQVLRHDREGDGEPLPVVWASSTAVYGEDDGSWVTETSSTSPRRFNGEVMVTAEGLVLHHAGTAGVVARLGGIYGPGRDRLLRTARTGDPVSRKWTNRIHSHDAALALAHLATAPRTLVPDIVNVVDTQPSRKHDVVAHVARLLDLPPPPVADESPDADRGKRVDGTRLLTTGFRHRWPTHREGYADLVAS